MFLYIYMSFAALHYNKDTFMEYNGIFIYEHEELILQNIITTTFLFITSIM